MKKVNRIICIILAALMIVTAPVTSYITANASELVVTAGLLDCLLGTFGISIGLGNQSDFWSQSNMDYMSQCIANGDVISMPGYGEVDFSNSQSVYAWINAMCAVDGFLVTGATGNLGLGEDVAKSIKNNCVKIDMISYHNTGTTATGAMSDYISDFIGDYNPTSEALAEDVRDCFTVIQGGGNFNDDDDDDEEKAARRQKFWRTFAAVTSAGMLGGSSAFPLAALKEASDSQYHEHDAAFADICFDGNYEMNANGEYVYRISSSDTIVIKGGYSSVQWAYDTTSTVQIAGYYDDNYVRFVDCNGKAVDLPCLNNGSYPFISINGFAGNIPVYSSCEAAVAALNSGDFSDADNINDAYRNFKNAVGIANDVIGDALNLYVGSLDSLSKLADAFPGLADVSDSHAGTPEALTSVNDYLSGASPSPSPDPDPDSSPGSGTNYSGILGKILTAINNVVSGINTLPAKIVNLFRPLLIEIFPNFAAVGNVILGLENMIVQALPDAMAARIIEIFPDAEAVGNAILGFPDAVAEACKGIVIEIPEIKIPEIVLPEPNLYLDISPVIEVPQPQVDVTLNPNYDITVQNDFTGLGAIIYSAIASALTDLFVPSEGDTIDKITTMKSYFYFVDDMGVIITAFQDSVFGIKPSPILKIPIGQVTSKYNYGLGSYIIIDISWYSTYKEFGDKVILAIMWACFIWRLFVLLPGIVNGTVGGIIRFNDLVVTRDLNNYYADDSFRSQLNRYDSGFNGRDR